jgi:RND family efflux transporter MFP subunit
MLPSSAEHKSKKGRIFVIVAVFLVCLIAGIGIASRIENVHSLRHATEEAAIPIVSVVQVQAKSSSQEIVLPGTIQAWHEAPIYARTNGYLKEWMTDIGSPVKTGDVLATIDTPDVDAQFHQAQADLATAQANNHLAQTTAKRWQNLSNTHAVSKQDVDDRTGAAAASAATMASSQANLDHLQQMEDFKQVVAPFDGIITARNTDIGALINAGSSAGQELFRIAETDKLRVYIQVPENYAAEITPDLKAELHLAEYPDKVFPATLDSTANAYDPSARTLLVELKIDNADHKLAPGGFAEVHVQLPLHANYIRVPVGALLFRADGLHIAVLGDNNKAVLKTVTISRDFGDEIEINAGIDSGSSVILNPPDSLTDGETVRIASLQQKDSKKEDK